MTLNRALSLCLALATSAAFVDTPGSAAAPESAPTVRLTAISSRVHASGTSLTIEATEPAAYVTTRPDPFTINLDFRNVVEDRRTR